MVVSAASAAGESGVGYALGAGWAMNEGLSKELRTQALGRAARRTRGAPAGPSGEGSGDEVIARASRRRREERVRPPRAALHLSVVPAFIYRHRSLEVFGLKLPLRSFRCLGRPQQANAAPHSATSRPPSGSMGFVSKLTVSAVGLFSKAILNAGFCSSVSVRGLDNLVKALEDQERNNGRGIVTGELLVLRDLRDCYNYSSSVANHIST